MAKHKDTILVLLITFLYHTMNQMFVPTLPLYIIGLGGSEVVVGVIVGLLSLGAIVSKAFFGKMATRHSSLLVLRIGLVIAYTNPFSALVSWPWFVCSKALDLLALWLGRRVCCRITRDRITEVCSLGSLQPPSVWA